MGLTTYRMAFDLQIAQHKIKLLGKRGCRKGFGVSKAARGMFVSPFPV